MFNEKDLLVRLQNGETMDDIAKELTAALNAANKEYEIQKEKQKLLEKEKLRKEKERQKLREKKAKDAALLKEKEAKIKAQEKAKIEALRNKNKNN